MKKPTIYALLGVMALSVLSISRADASGEKYQMDLARVVRKYDGAARVPAASLKYLANYYGNSQADVRADLFLVEEALNAPPTPAYKAPAPAPVYTPPPEPVYVPEVDMAEEEAAVEEADVLYSKSRVDIGYRIKSDDRDNSWKAQEYDDLNTGPMVGIEAMTQNDSQRVEFKGENLFFDTRKIDAQFKGEKAKFNLKHSSTPHNFMFNGKSLHQGAGTANLHFSDTTTAAVAAAATGAARATVWDNAYKALPADLDLGIVRDRTNFKVDVFSGQGDTTLEVRRDKREGTRIGYGYDGSDRWELPVPVDYTTTDYTLAHERTQGNLWFKASLLTSEFANANNTLAWESGTVVGRNLLMDLAPNNERTMFSVATSVRNLPNSGRVNANFARAKMKQNDFLLPFSNTLGAANPLLPQAQAGQEVETTNWKVAYSAKPTDKVRLKTSYKGYEYEDKGDQLAFGGTANADGNFGADVSGARTTEHLSYKKTTGDIEVSYLLDAENTASLSFSREEMERHNRAVAEQTTDTWALKWDSNPTEKFQFRFGYALAQQNHNGFVWWNQFSHFYNPYDPALNRPAAGPPNNQLPWFRNPQEAAQDRTTADLAATFLPTDEVAMTFTARLAETDFTEANTMGMKTEDSNMFGFDVDYRPIGKKWGMNAFANIEEIKSQLDSRTWRAGFTADPFTDPGALYGTAGSPSALNAPYTANASDWTMTQKDEMLTYGLNFDVELTKDKLFANFGWSHTENDGGADFTSPLGTAGAAAVPGAGNSVSPTAGPDSNRYVPMPVNMSDMDYDVLTLKFDFKPREGRTISLGLRNEEFKWKDYYLEGWGYVQVDENGSEAGANNMGTQPKDFDNMTIWASYGVDF